MTKERYLPGKITFEGAHTIDCGSCHKEDFTHASLRSDARNVFSKRGWVKTDKHGWLCRKCAQEKR